MTKRVGIVILAAGKGTRMKVKESKPMVSILGKRLVDFPLAAGFDFLEAENVTGDVTLVTGYMKESLESYLSIKYEKLQKISFVHQKEQLGTADALKTFFDQNPEAKKTDYTLVLCADTPLIRASDLSELYKVITTKNLDAVAATFNLDDPQGYGRIVRGSTGFSIVEQKDANNEQLKITEVNSGLYFIKTSFALEHLGKIDSNNKSGEFYLTDLFKEEYQVAPIKFKESACFFGVNNLTQLENMEKEIRSKKIAELAQAGVRFIDRETVYLDDDVVIEEGSVIYPNVHILGNSHIGQNVTIEPGCVIKNSQIKNNVTLKANCYLEQANIANGASVGPFAHLRPGADIGEESKIGNFVEIKKSKLAKGVKVSHLSYVGDAEIGESTNIGCGFITCNYDGANKHLTKIGSGCFIGSDTQMIAPVEIGNECYIASGSTINQSVKDGDFAIARSRQVNKEGLAKRFIKKKS